MGFLRAQDRMYQAGGADEIPDYLDRYFDPNGPARSSYPDEVSAYKAGGYKRQGFARPHKFRILNLSSLDVEVPEVIWQVCVDQSEASTTKNGKPFDHPKFINEQVELHYIRSFGEWKIHLISSRIVETKRDCEGA